MLVDGSGYELHITSIGANGRSASSQVRFAIDNMRAAQTSG